MITALRVTFSPAGTTLSGSEHGTMLRATLSRAMQPVQAAELGSSPVAPAHRGIAAPAPPARFASAPCHGPLTASRKGRGQKAPLETTRSATLTGKKFLLVFQSVPLVLSLGRVWSLLLTPL